MRARNRKDEALPSEPPSVTDLEDIALDRTAVDLEPLGADATSEIEAVDIVEIDGALTAAPPPGGHPSSLGPIAMNVSADPPRVTFPSLPSWTPTPSDASTLELARAAGVPFFSARTAVIALSVAGLCLLAGAAGAVLGYSQLSRDASAARPAEAVHAPRTVVILGARLLDPPTRHRKGVSSAAR